MAITSFWWTIMYQLKEEIQVHIPICVSISSSLLTCSFIFISNPSKSRKKPRKYTPVLSQYWHYSGDFYFCISHLFSKFSTMSTFKMKITYFSNNTCNKYSEVSNSWNTQSEITCNFRTYVIKILFSSRFAFIVLICIWMRCTYKCKPIQITYIWGVQYLQDFSIACISFVEESQISFS